MCFEDEQDLSGTGSACEAMAATPAGTYKNPIYDEIFGMAQVLKLNGLLVLYSARCSKYPFTNRQ